MVEATETLRVVRSLRGGRLIIPTEVREALGLDLDAMLELTVIGGELRIKKADSSDAPAPNGWLMEPYDHFAPASQEAIDKGYSEDEINGWIDEAVAAVRAERGRG